MLRQFGNKLHSVIEFKYFTVLLRDSEQNLMRILEVLGGERAVVAGMQFSMSESPSAVAWETQQPLVINDLLTETRFERPIQILSTQGIRSLCCIPLTSPRQRLGALCLGSARPGAYANEDFSVLSLLIGQLAIAIESAVNFERMQDLQRQVTEERDRLKLLLEVNNAVVSHLEMPELIGSVPSSVRQAMRCDAACLSLPDREGRSLRILGLDYPDARGFVQEDMMLPIDGSSPGIAYTTGKPFVFGAPPTTLAAIALQANAAEGFNSGCFLPIICGGHKLGVLHLLDRRPNAFPQGDVDFLLQVANQVALALENALEYGKIVDAREQLAKESRYLRSELRSERGFAEILGRSPTLQRVLSRAELVAPTSSTVLIQGETGSGKELIARAIHNLSSRRDHIFVKLNCAAIPLGLLESELFGHEKGAFTGAIAQKVGRFELANQGTLFLDEIGDIPLELQPKLLRVLQEQEFERLGSTRPVRVNVRVIAATHRDLGRMIEDGQFRADLFYRLNVFPIVVPPLRERPEDIPDLVRSFVQKFSAEMRKQSLHVPEAQLQALMEYDWPGNVRELENFIERAVILSPGDVLMAPISELRTGKVSASPATFSSFSRGAAPSGVSRSSTTAALKHVEREHILSTLRDTKWVLGGENGAAMRLGIPRTTLLYKMRRLGISRDGS